MTGDNTKQRRRGRDLRSQLKDGRLVILFSYFLSFTLMAITIVPSLIYFVCDA
jgi:hypothetical protein